MRRLRKLTNVSGVAAAALVSNGPGSIVVQSRTLQWASAGPVDWGYRLSVFGQTVDILDCAGPGWLGVSYDAHGQGNVHARHSATRNITAAQRNRRPTVVVSV
jgi:hypothetical protein